MKALFSKVLVLTAVSFAMGSGPAEAQRYFAYTGCMNFEGGGSMVYRAECADRRMPGQSGTRAGNVFQCIGWTYSYTAVSDSACPQEI